MRVLAVLRTHEMLETLDRGKYELRIRVSVPPGIFLEKTTVPALSMTVAQMES